MSGMSLVEQAQDDVDPVLSMSEEFSSCEDLRSSMFAISQSEWWMTESQEDNDSDDTSSN